MKHLLFAWETKWTGDHNCTGLLQPVTLPVENTAMTKTIAQHPGLDSHTKHTAAQAAHSWILLCVVHCDAHHQTSVFGVKLLWQLKPK